MATTRGPSAAAPGSMIDVATRRAIIARCCCGEGPAGSAKQVHLSDALRAVVEARQDNGELTRRGFEETTRSPEPDEAQLDAEETLELDDVTRSCEVSAGPTYVPTGTIPVTVGGGRKRATFSFSADFATRTAKWWEFWRSDSVPGCCEVRQYIKWDKAYHDSKGGPPHGGFPSTATYGVWYEDRDASDKRYGHRSGPHSDPIAGGGDEYTTGGVRDQANGDRYDGRDAPAIAAARVGQWQFKLAAIDTCHANSVKARSSVITINW